jgi:hypothetical protein
LGYSEVLAKNPRVDLRNKQWVLSILKSANSWCIESMRHRIAEYSRRKPTAVSLQDLYRYNLVDDPVQRIRNSQFLHKELPIRLAQRIEELSR